MSLLLFSIGVSSLAETTEELASKCQGTSGPGLLLAWRWPSFALHLGKGSGTNCGSFQYFYLSIYLSIALLSITLRRDRWVGSHLIKDRDTRKKKKKTKRHQRPQQTARTNNTVFHILESASKASRSRYESVEASSHMLVDHDMERVTQLCKMCQRTDKTPTAPPMIPV